MNNRIKSGIKQLTDDCYAETLNDLTKKFVVSAIVATIAFIGIGMIFPDAEEVNE